MSTFSKTPLKRSLVFNARLVFYDSWSLYTVYTPVRLSASIKRKLWAAVLTIYALLTQKPYRFIYIHRALCRLKIMLKIPDLSFQYLLCWPALRSHHMFAPSSGRLSEVLLYTGPATRPGREARSHHKISIPFCVFSKAWVVSVWLFLTASSRR